MSMQRFRVGVGHRVERTAWRYPNADAVARPSRNHCPNHFKKKTAAVFNRATILVGSFVAAILKRSEEHTSELQSPDHLVCRLLLEKKKPPTHPPAPPPPAHHPPPPPTSHTR